jgi:ABC-2 type transport system permease protein
MLSSKALILARREYSALVRTRAFIFGLLLAPLLMSLAFFLIPRHAEPADVGPRRVVLLDDTGQLAAPLAAALGAAGFELDAPEVPKDPALAASFEDGVRAGSTAAVIVVGADAFAADRDDDEARVVLTVRNITHQSTAWLHQTLDDLVQLERLEAAGLDSERARRILGGVKVRLRLPDSDGKTGLELALQAAALPLLTLLMAFFSIMSSAPYMLQSVIEEKQQRIAEVLLGSVSPFALMTGKLLGAAGAGLTVVLVYAVLGGIGAAHFGVALEVRPGLMLLGLFDVLVALILFGSLFLAAGATATELKDAQGWMMPLTLLLTLPMMSISQLLGNPDGHLALGLSMFPLTAPLIMPVRLAVTTVPAWQLAVSAFGALAFTVASVWAAARIFRVGILSQGRAPRLGELLRWIRAP